MGSLANAYSQTSQSTLKFASSTLKREPERCSGCLRSDPKVHKTVFLTWTECSRFVQELVAYQQVLDLCWQELSVEHDGLHPNGLNYQYGSM